MKKLLLIAALATMATTAMAVNPAKDTKVKTDVIVKAEIVSGGLKITDIDGRPLVLDLGQANQGEETSLANSVEYKITAKEAAATNPIKLNMAFESKEINLYNNIPNVAGTAIDVKDTLKATLILDADAKEIAVGATETTGKIFGKTNTTAANNAGKYKGNAVLTATVTE